MVNEELYTVKRTYRLFRPNYFAIEFNDVEEGIYECKVRSIDQYTGRRSRWVYFENFEIYNEAPTTPSNLYASDILYDELTIHWGESTDDWGISGYEIHVDDDIYITDNPEILTYTVSELSPSTTYHVEVYAKDSQEKLSILPA